MLPKRRKLICTSVVLSFVDVLTLESQEPANPTLPTKSSYQFPVAEEDFTSFFRRISAAQPEVRNRQMTLLNQRYDLRDRPDPT